MMVFCYLLVFGLITTHLSPSTAEQAGSCLDCPLEDGDSRGKLSFNPIIPVDEDYLKTIALANSPGLSGAGAGGSGMGLQQQKVRFFHVASQQHPKILAQQLQQPHRQQRIPSLSSSIPMVLGAPSAPSNLLHVYTLLNTGSAVEPRLLIDEHYLPDPGVALPSSRIAKKAERGMLVDVMDYVSKPDDRNRRVGQNMRSSG